MLQNSQKKVNTRIFEVAGYIFQVPVTYDRPLLKDMVFFLEQYKKAFTFFLVSKICKEKTTTKEMEDQRRPHQKQSE